MRLFTHQLHNPAMNRHLVPPASMWRELRERLDRLAHSAPHEPPLRVNGMVDVSESDVQCSLCVVVNGEMERLRDIGTSGRFRLELPATENVQLVFVQVGYLPRVVEIRPTHRASDSTASNAPRRLDLRVKLTRSASIGGARIAPLRERITLGHGRAPLLVEYDREPSGSCSTDFWPLLKRAS